MHSSPMYKTQTVPVATAALLGAAGQIRLMGFILFGGSANTQVEFKDAATDTGTVVLGANCLAYTSIFVDLSDIGGVMFNTGCFCKPAGAASICYCWYE
jgi:hypothetical protein